MRISAILPALGLLAACAQNGSTPLPQSAAAQGRAPLVLGKSWIKPEAKGEDLIYVANANFGTVAIYDYKTRVLVGTINLGEDYATSGECVGKTGDVYVTNFFYQNIIEFAHGSTTPIKTIQDGNFSPYACSVDFQSGNLAVANNQYYYSTYREVPGNITIFKKYGGTETYTDSTMSLVNACGYDDSGNLLVSGNTEDTSGDISFAMLPKGEHKLVNITLSPNQGEWPWVANLQWDAKEWAVTVLDFRRSETVYRFKIANGVAHEEGATRLLGDAGDFGQTWITRLHGDIEQSTRLVAGVGGADTVQYYRYPSGGVPFEAIEDEGFPDGITVSLAKPQ